MKSVCKDCTERYTACWGNCPKYLEAKKKHDEAKQVRIKDILTNEAINSVQYNGLKKCVKKKER